MFRRAIHRATAYTLVSSALLASACTTTPPEDREAEAFLTARRAPKPKRAGSPLHEGRYLGYASLPERGVRLPVTLDLIEVGAQGPETFLQGFLKLSQGGFTSHEYVTSFYSNVTVKHGNPAVTFAANAAELMLTDVTLTSTGLKGTLSSERNTVKAPVELVFAPRETLASAPWEKLYAAQKTAATLAGTYEAAACDGKRQTLTVNTVKWRASVATDLPGLGGYKISAQVAGGSKYGDGEIDAMTGQLVFKAGHAQLSCTARSDALTCGSCTYRRSTASAANAVLDGNSGPHWYERTERFVTHEALQKGLDQQLPDGQFYGYLHHEQTNTYQLVALELRRSDPYGPSPQLGGLATLHFGEGDSAELLFYRIADRKASDAKRLVLDTDGDAVLVIVQRGVKSLAGVWYSRTFGRVGSFHLQRGLVPVHVDHARTLEAVSGLYESDSLDLELAAQTAPSSNPALFYPLQIFGAAQALGQGAPRCRVEEGRYDFYTDRLGLELDDGRVLSGRFHTTEGGKRHLLLTVPSASGMLAQPEKAQVFQPVERFTSMAAKASL